MTEEQQAKMAKDMSEIFERFSDELDKCLKTIRPELLIAHVGVVVVPIEQDQKLSAHLPINVMSTVGNDARALYNMASSMMQAADMRFQEYSNDPKH